VFDLSFHRNSTGNVGVIVLYVAGQLIDSTITAYPGCRAYSNRWYHCSQAIEAKSRSPNDIETGQVRSNKIGFCAPTRETDNNTCSFIAHQVTHLWSSYVPFKIGVIISLIAINMLGIPVHVTCWLKERSYSGPVARSSSAKFQR